MTAQTIITDADAQGIGLPMLPENMTDQQLRAEYNFYENAGYEGAVHGHIIDALKSETKRRLFLTRRPANARMSAEAVQGHLTAAVAMHAQGFGGDLPTR